MKQFILLFRLDTHDPAAQPSQQEMENYMKLWAAWLEEIASQGRLAVGGNHLDKSGVLLRPAGIVEQRPYQARGESVAGYIVIYGEDLEEAVAIAAKCPILNGSEKNSVEVRETASTS